MVVTGSLALGMDGGGAHRRWAAARTGNSWASAAALAATRRVDAGCSSCAPGCCPARRSPSGRVGSRPPAPDQGALARAPTRPAPSALPRSAFAAPARTALRACAPLAISPRPLSDTHRARLFPWQARDGRDRKRRGCGAGGPGLHARARVKPAGASAETWRRARPPPQPSRPPPPPFRCRRVRVRVRVCVSPLRSVSHA